MCTVCKILGRLALNSYFLGQGGKKELFVAEDNPRGQDLSSAPACWAPQHSSNHVAISHDCLHLDRTKQLVENMYLKKLTYQN